jgi:hypothetical protein
MLSIHTGADSFSLVVAGVTVQMTKKLTWMAYLRVETHYTH